MKRARCVKCGKVTRGARLPERCRRIVRRMGGRFYCAGELVTIAPKSPTEPAARGRVVDYQAKYDQAAAQLSGALSRIGRAVTSAKLWRGRLAYYEKQLSTIDRPKREPKPKPARKPTRRYNDD